MLPEKIVIPFQTLTPIWTGDANRETSYIKETSIIGGLRFWAEAVLRTLGKRVCDDSNPCIFEKDNEIEDMCSACQIFGCTGLGRSFSLSIKGNVENKAIGRIELTDKETRPKWFLEQSGKIGQNGPLEMIIRPMRNSAIAKELALTIALMLKWGTIGAKDQFGHGIISADIPAEIIKRAKLVNEIPNKTSTGLCLEDFFFFSADTTGNNIKVPFLIRYGVRERLRDETDRAKIEQQKKLRHYFCGSLERNVNIASKYNIGLTDKKKIFGWGYFPKNDRQFSISRDTCLSILYEQIKSTPTVEKLRWVEFNSNRDNVNKNMNIKQFIEYLLEGGWK